MADLAADYTTENIGEVHHGTGLGPADIDNRLRSERLSNRGVGSVPNREDGHRGICH